MPTVLLIDDTAAPVFSAPDVGVRANRRDLVLTDAEGLQSWLASSAVGAAVVVVPIRPDPGVRPLQLLAEKRPDVLRVGVFVDEQPSAITASAALVHRAFPGSDAVAAIEDAVKQGERFRALLTDRRLAAVVGRLRRLPTVPSLYRRLMRECRSDHASARTIGELVAEEPSVAARVLQAANSPYYGRRGHVMDPTQAVHRIGVEGVKALVLTGHLLAEFSEAERQRFDLYGLWRHSLIASSFARIILQDVVTSHADVETAAAAALLHDLGRLLLAVNLSQEYDRVLAAVRSGERSLVKAEVDEFGVSHAAIGAQLLALWGVPVEIVEAVARSHQAGISPDRDPDPAVAVQAADLLASEVAGTLDEGDRVVAEVFGAGRPQSRWSGWREACFRWARPTATSDGQAAGS
jgi:putative nucleotidyltransferase with HDIG domain